MGVEPLTKRTLALKAEKGGTELHPPDAAYVSGMRVCFLSVLSILGSKNKREVLSLKTLKVLLINSKKEKQWSTYTLHAQGKFKYNTVSSDLPNIIQFHLISPRIAF
jgi:hypothetical protein